MNKAIGRIFTVFFTLMTDSYWEQVWAADHPRHGKWFRPPLAFINFLVLVGIGWWAGWLSSRTAMFISVPLLTLPFIPARKDIKFLWRYYTDEQKRKDELKKLLPAIPRSVKPSVHERTSSSGGGGFHDHYPEATGEMGSRPEPIDSSGWNT